MPGGIPGMPFPGMMFPNFMKPQAWQAPKVGDKRPATTSSTIKGPLNLPQLPSKKPKHSVRPLNIPSRSSIVANDSSSKEIKSSQQQQDTVVEREEQQQSKEKMVEPEAPEINDRSSRRKKEISFANSTEKVEMLQPSKVI